MTGRRATPKPVKLRWPPTAQPAPRLILDDVVDPANAHHHDPVRLAAAVIRHSRARSAFGGGASGRTTGPDGLR